VERWSATSCPFLPAASKERVAAERSGGTNGRKLLGTLLDCICRLLRVPDMVEAEVVKGQTPKMMDRERQEKDLQEVFDATQAAYLAAIENTFALQERTLEFTRTLIEAPEEALRTQAESNRAMLKTLIEESRGIGKRWRPWLESRQRSTRAFSVAPSPITRTSPSSRRPGGHLTSSPERGQRCLRSSSSKAGSSVPMQYP
jgi:hypothetical protein